MKRAPSRVQRIVNGCPWPSRAHIEVGIGPDYEGPLWQALERGLVKFTKDKRIVRKIRTRDLKQ